MCNITIINDLQHPLLSVVIILGCPMGVLVILLRRKFVATTIFASNSTALCCYHFIMLSIVCTGFLGKFIYELYKIINGINHDQINESKPSPKINNNFFTIFMLTFFQVKQLLSSKVSDVLSCSLKYIAT